ncbi:MAG: SGNH/GDSL hydrolase family protein [Bacteroidota bacterium]
MDFKGISDQQEKNIQLFSISPLNRKLHLFQEDSVKGWNNYSFYHKSVGFILYDSILQKIDSIDVFLNNTTYNIQPEDLQLFNKINGKKSYLLPEIIKSNYKLFKVKNVLLNAGISKYLFFGLLVITLITFFIHKIIVLLRSGNKIKLKTILPVIKTTVICLLIASGIFYGYLFIKYSLVSFVTSFFIILLAFIIFWLIAQAIIRFFDLNQKTSRILSITVVVFFSLILIIEMTLRIANVNESYNEANELYYVSGFNPKLYHANNNDAKSDKTNTHRPQISKNEKRKEFSYQISTNKEGLRDIDHPIKKPHNQYRIICLGDSFTEGVGAPQDSTWPVLLQHELSKVSTKKDIKVFNAGVSSSDIFYEYNLLKNKMLKYSPDLVLLSLSSSDYDFYKFRGGFERFTENGIQYRDPPPWEKFYAASYIFRFILNNIYNYNGMFSPVQQKVNYKQASKDIYRCVYRFKKLAEKENFKLVLVFVDDQNTVYFPMKKKIKDTNMLPVIDLFEYSNEVLKLTENDRQKLYWNIDGHCNSDGYYMFANGIMWNFDKSGILDSLKNK